MFCAIVCFNAGVAAVECPRDEEGLAEASLGCDWEKMLPILRRWYCDTDTSAVVDKGGAGEELVGWMTTAQRSIGNGEQSIPPGLRFPGLPINCHGSESAISSFGWNHTESRGLQHHCDNNHGLPCF